MANMPVIDITGLSFRYEKEKVLENINLSVPKGAFLAIVGPNGSGKSTLLKLILGLLKPQTGEIRLFGEPLRSFDGWEKIGYVSQKANSFNTGFPATVEEVVSSGLVRKIGLFRFMKAKEKQKVREALTSVGMADFADKNIGELSGGQQQRVFIARALVSDPELLILDEPTVGVDQRQQDIFYKMLEKLNKKAGITLLLVTHDIGTVSQAVTHVACLNKYLHFHGESSEFEKIAKNGLSEFYGYDVHQLSHHHHGEDGK
ncbi:zinc ABC transporter ATP-binding protein [Bacillus sp. FJAT-27225]|uniref:metal ABC transporter ATP-binding protein n=1 Tax=Bacillus sp. FJAT-27225 TaxID=1743144 RepID=UPI00080C33F8|nr:metal ABC transporter ATP-binding protein [Bacillus sp. FJAT-27225]OCA91559.1 zinc ABC transporter ATP-binding protein [Bacillus sp. FJAT-27225]